MDAWVAGRGVKSPNQFFQVGRKVGWAQGQGRTQLTLSAICGSWSQKHARKHSPTHLMRQGLQGELAHCSPCCTYTESDYESNIWYRRSVAARSLAHLSLAPEAPNVAGLSCMAHSSRHAK